MDLGKKLVKMLEKREVLKMDEVAYQVGWRNGCW